MLLKHIPIQPPPKLSIQDLDLTERQRNFGLLADKLINAEQKMLKLQLGDIIQGLQYVNLAQTLAMDVQLGILSCTLQWN